MNTLSTKQAKATAIKVGDTVWIAGFENPKLTEGKVVHAFTLEHEGYSPDHVQYVVSVATPVDPVLVVRDWQSISLTKKGPLNFLKDLKSSLASLSVFRD